VRRHVGRGARRLIDAAAGDSLDPDRLLERFRHHYSEVLTDHTPPFVGVDASLRQLARRHTLAVASNKPLAWVQRLVEHLGWSPLMGAVVGPESGGTHKPDPTMIEVALQRCGCSRTDALLVGDMEVDVTTGRNAGIPVVGVATGSTPAAELLLLGCVVVLESVTELPAWLARRT
jgi:phosphoglycolate phosphatase